jgi:sulfur-oxidizing protein SoxX
MRRLVLPAVAVTAILFAATLVPRLGLAQPTSPAATPPAAAAPAPVALSGPALDGQKLAYDRAMGNCLACHTMRGSDVPSDVGPKLEGIKAQFPDRKQLFDIVYDEEARNPQTVMPLFGKNLILTRQQIEEVVDFLYTL